MEHRDGGRLRLRIGGHRHAGVCVRRHRVQATTRLVRLQAAEHLTHEALGRRRLDITGHHDANAIGRVVVTIEVAQSLGWEHAQRVRQTDRQALCVSGGPVHRMIGHRLEARAHAETLTPFLEHHATFLVDLLVLEEHPAREVGERLRRPFERTRPIRGHVEHVDGLVVARVGVHVGPEGHAHRLEVVDEFSGLEVGGAIEGHVLEHVRQPALVVRLVDGPGLHGQPE